MKFSELCQIDRMLVYGGMTVGMLGTVLFMLLELFFHKAWIAIKRLFHYALNYYRNHNKRNEDV